MSTPRIILIALTVLTSWEAASAAECPDPPYQVRVDNIRKDGSSVWVTVSDIPLNLTRVTCAVKDKDGRYLASKDNQGMAVGHVDTLRFDLGEQAELVVNAECVATPRGY